MERSLTSKSDKALVRELLFLLLKSGVDHSETDAERLRMLRSDIWSEVYALASSQGVSAFLWDSISRLALPLPRSLKLQWACHAEYVEKEYARRRSVLSRLAGLFTSRGLRVMVLKGYGLSLCYPEPSHRPCGDIDIWLYGEQQQGDELLRREMGVSIDEQKHHHTVCHIDGVMVENHYDFLNLHAHPSNRAIERRLRELAGKPGETIRIEGHPVQLPCADFNALFLLRHAASHFAAIEISLRHVVDWALFVQKDHDKINWAELERVAREQNMDRFLHCLNALSIDLLGISADCFPPFERDTALERRVLNDILHPEFDEKPPRGNIAKGLIFKFRRWWANRWKHRIVYREGLCRTFFAQLYAHLLKPQSLTH